jgi:arginase family enzyme
MTRYGVMFGPDITFLGVDRCDITDRPSFADADVVIVGAPFDGGTSYRPRARSMRCTSTRDWMATQKMQSYEMTEIVARGLTAVLDEGFTIGLDDCDAVFLSVDVVEVAPRCGVRH